MLVKQYLLQIENAIELAESVKWHELEHAIYWVDACNQCLHIWYARDNTSKMIELPYKIRCFAFTQSKQEIIAVLDDSIALVNINTLDIKWLAQVEQNFSNTYINEGKCDTNGRFWFGTAIQSDALEKNKSEWCLQNFDDLPLRIDGTNSIQQAALYCGVFSRDSSSQKGLSLHYDQCLSGLYVSTCLCFSNDMSVMFHCDAVERKLYQYDLDESGNIVDKRLFIEFSDNEYPSSAFVDKQDNIWLALWGPSCVVCYNADAQEIVRYPMPVTQISSLTIGGPNMDWLIIATSKQGLSAKQIAKQPRAGNVLVYELELELGVVEAKLKI